MIAVNHRKVVYIWRCWQKGQISIYAEQKWKKNDNKDVSDCKKKSRDKKNPVEKLENIN